MEATLTLPQAGELLGVDDSDLSRLIRIGALPEARKIDRPEGRVWTIGRQHLAAVASRNGWTIDLRDLADGALVDEPERPRLGAAAVAPVVDHGEPAPTDAADGPSDDRTASDADDRHPIGSSLFADTDDGPQSPRIPGRPIEPLFAPSADRKQIPTTESSQTTDPAPTPVAPSAAPTPVAPSAAPTPVAPSAAPTPVAPLSAPTPVAASAAPTPVAASAAPTPVAASAAPTPVAGKPEPEPFDVTLLPSQATVPMVTAQPAPAGPTKPIVEVELAAEPSVERTATEHQTEISDLALLDRLLESHENRVAAQIREQEARMALTTLADTHNTTTGELDVERRERMAMAERYREERRARAVADAKVAELRERVTREMALAETEKEARNEALNRGLRAERDAANAVALLGWRARRRYRKLNEQG